MIEDLVGIPLREQEQFSVLQGFADYYREQPWAREKSSGLRFYLENDSYSYADGLVLYFMLRHLQPQRIIEIGAGYSTMAILDTNEKFLEKRAHLTCIEPEPAKLFWLFEDKREALSLLDLVVKPVQEVKLEFFMKLQAGDILFIDSSHVLKTGSDVNYLLLEVLPKLNTGVYVHFHDICYPFEYPKGWIGPSRPWNEAYALKAFLLFNAAFDIVLFTNYLRRFQQDWLRTNMPLFLEAGSSSSLWLRKTQ